MEWIRFALKSLINKRYIPKGVSISMRQFVIELVGMDGSGKTSIAEKVSLKTYHGIRFEFLNGFYFRKYSQELEDIAHRYEMTKREMFSDDLVNMTWMMDLLNTGHSKVKASYQKGMSIILDRYILSAKTYSLSTTDSDISYLFGIYDTLPQPDMYIYLNVDIDTAIKRIEKRGQPLAYYETPQYLCKIKSCYEKFLGEYSNVFIVRSESVV